MDQYDNLGIPEHRPGARILGLVLIVGAVIAVLLLLNSQFDNDPSVNRPGAPEGYDLPTTTSTAPSTTTVVEVHAAAFTGNIAEYHQPQPETAQAMDTDPGLVTVQGQVYEVDAPNRPACWVEPDSSMAGYGVHLYPDLALVDDSGFGFEVSCPTAGRFPNAVHCQEDEIVTVKQDTDPTHGLTWVCVNAEQYENGERP